MRFLYMIAIVALFPCLSRAEDGAQEFEMRFADGSRVHLFVLEAAVQVTTRFGKLDVPWSEIHSIEVGLRYPDGMIKDIETAITQLGGTDFKLRESAQARLLLLGEWAYPYVEKASQAGHPEAMRRARIIMDTLKEKIPDNRLPIKMQDSLQTSEFPIQGRITSTTLKVRNAIFGETTVKLAELRSIRSVSASAPSK